MARRGRSAALQLVDKHQQELQAAMAEMTEEMVECRDIAHSYRKWSTRWIPADREWESQLLCVRCGTIRIRRINGSTGAIVASSYQYAEGYLVKGLGRLDQADRGALRLHSMQFDTDKGRDTKHVG